MGPPDEMGGGRIICPIPGHAAGGEFLSGNTSYETTGGMFPACTGGFAKPQPLYSCPDSFTEMKGMISLLQ
jgi:hypothetical protein